MTSIRERTETLKPCPHCGSEAEYDSRRWSGVDLHDPEHTGHAVYCTKCPLPLVGGCVLYETEEDAKAAWNTRALAPALDRVIAEVEAQRNFMLAAMLRALRTKTKGD